MVKAFCEHILSMLGLPKVTQIDIFAQVIV